MEGTRAGLRRGARALALAFALGLLAAGPAGPGSAHAQDDELEPAPEGVDPREIARAAEDSLRSDTTIMEVTMTIESPRLPRPRSVRFKSWDDRPGKRSFIHILSPPKEEHTTFLKLHPNLWMYIPRVERTMRIPPSMMLQSWMGSDFTNDDLVNESSELDDYDHVLLGVDPDAPEAEGGRAYVIEYRPHEDAPVVWGRIVAWVDPDHGTPLRQDFYDEDGVLIRRLDFREVREVDGRRVPHLWELTPLDKQGHRTAIRLESIDFDAELDDSLFTKRNLARRR